MNYNQFDPNGQNNQNGQNNPNGQNNQNGQNNSNGQNTDNGYNPENMSLNSMYDPYNDLYRQGMQQKPNLGFSIASMVLGIFSIVCCCITYAALITSILAIVFSVVAKIKNERFDGMAIAGLVCGIIGCVLAASDIILSAVFSEYLAELEKELKAMYGTSV